jgi:hypothetical protein
LLHIAGRARRNAPLAQRKAQRAVEAGTTRGEFVVAASFRI